MLKQKQGTENLWKKAADSLAQLSLEKYLNIDERELKIYQTPEGTLFNTEVIDRNADIIEIPKNVKRDYSFTSYKEQLADLQLRKEIAEKNRKAGILTEKQKKAVEEELKIEKDIRIRLKQLYDSFEEKIKLLFIACKKEPKKAFENISFLYDTIVPLIKSPFVAKIAVKGYLSYRDAIFEITQDNLYKLIGQATLRALEAKFLMDHWCEISLDEQIRQSFNLLSSACFVFEPIEEEETETELDQQEQNKDELEATEEELTITAAKLAFLLPFFQQIFIQTPGSFDVDLRIRVATFLKSAFLPNFIKSDEIISFPMLKLATLLVESLSLESSLEYLDLLNSALSQFMEMLNQNNEANPTIPALHNFLIVCLSQLAGPDAIRRKIILKLILLIHDLLKRLLKEDRQLLIAFAHRLLLVEHDPDNECVQMAERIRALLNLTHDSNSYKNYLSDLCDENPLVREEAARTLQSLVKLYPETMVNSLLEMEKAYKLYSKFEPAHFDSIGRKLRDEWDPWEKRTGIANAICLLAECLQSPQLVVQLIKIVVPNGLKDRADDCRNLMRNAAAIAIQKHGSTLVDELLPFVEKELNNLSKTAEHDNLRQGLVVIIGTLAQYLEGDEAKVRKIVARLIETLSTPSQQVQEAVAACLPALVRFLRGEARTLVQNMFVLLTNADSYGERRGAAYGIASITKGLGVASIKEMNIGGQLKDLLVQKQKPLHREGALLCIEMLCRTIGKLFEPYLVHLLPEILAAFSDANESVRRAADDTAKAMMRSLSAHGVKLLLPSLLRGLDDDSWRTKCASAELLGAMSNCAPRQLSTSLPSIVPKLCEALTDTHGKVQKTSERALKQIAQVIQNPECLAISSHLIQALVDPPGKTASCLQTIVNNKFVHYIDSPSLALMVPIINRALKERNTEAKRMAAQIIANIYSLIDHQDMEPYLNELLPGLKTALRDPVPEVRTVAAKALGSIIQYSAPKTSENIQSDIMPWIKDNLVSENSSVDRQGAAQGLSEVIAAIGDEFLEQNLPGVIRITESPVTAPYIRDGYILLYIYLPIALGDRFLPYISQIIPSILKALADETEYVRDSALRAGQRLITAYSTHARKLLLPQLQSALIHENWRIRHASVKLIGDFLFNISGVSGKMTSETTGEDDTMGSETASKAIVRCIGQKSRDELLAGIYLTRYDIALVVRQAASHVWKVIVPNTPRTLRDIMRPLFELLLHCLSSTTDDQQQMAVRCLSELVKKMGERILTIVIPILEGRLTKGGVPDRRGVALALNEIIGNTHREVVETHASSFTKAIRTCLSDENQSVRDAAGQTFASFHGVVGHAAVDEIVSPMLEDFNQSGGAHIIDGLCSIMAGQSGRQIFQNLLPKLSRPPVNSHALCRLAISSDALSKNLGKVITVLLNEEMNVSTEEHIQNCMPVLFSVEEDENIRIMLSAIFKSIADGRNALTAAILLNEYIENSSLEIEDLDESILEFLISGFVSLYNCSDPAVLDKTIASFNSLVKQIDASFYPELVIVLKKTIKGFTIDAKKSDEVSQIRALCQPKGWQPLLPILREGILTGSIEIKEVAANCIFQLIPLSSENGLKPHVVSLAGPLIRILGDRHPLPVKIAAINGLLKLMEKMPLFLKPFLPQMQSVFLKNLQEPTSQSLRQLASQGIEHLLSLHPKPEALLKELNKLIQAGEDEGEGLNKHPVADKLVEDLIMQVKGKL